MISLERGELHRLEMVHLAAVDRLIGRRPGCRRASARRERLLGDEGAVIRKKRENPVYDSRILSGNREDG